MAEYTFNEYADMHLMYGKASGNSREARRLYSEHFPNRILPDRKTFDRVDRNLKEKGTFIRKAGGVDPVRNTRTIVLEQDILDEVENNPTSSVRKLGILGMLFQVQRNIIRRLNKCVELEVFQQSHEDLLRNGVQMNLNNRPGRERVWYQMDGAPPHNSRSVNEALTEIFEDRWIGNNGPFRWPPRTPDGNSLDYFVWGFIKNMVYSNPVTTMEDMKSRVRTAFNSLTPDLIRSATHENLLKRLHICLSRGGDVFKHILKYTDN